MFRRIEFQNFKALANFSIVLRPVNVLTGPNNAGKSTLLDAFRALSGAYRYATRFLPGRVFDSRGREFLGYKVPASYLPISCTNIQTDYNNEDSIITFTLENGRKLILLFDKDQYCRLLLDPEGPDISTTYQFRKIYPASLSIVPTLGPLEEDEELLSDEYVTRWSSSRRAHRMLRNIWFRKPAADFRELQEFIQSTWPGMEILRPERHGFGPETRIRMFCKENHIDREVFWAGFGFQVWLQFLTHVIAADHADTIIVDEPDIYLHPDLQHKLFKILTATGKQVVLATHSVEIINQADHEDVVLINKAYKSARRVNDIEDLQAAIEALGSSQNLHLSRLSKGRRVLFFEGQDFQLIKRFAAKLSFNALSAALNVTVIGVGGFSEHRKVENAVWTFNKILNTEIDVAALFDRDYLTEKQAHNFLEKMRKVVPRTFLLNRKEIENYLLLPSAVGRAIAEKIGKNEFVIDGKHVTAGEYAAILIKRATVAAKKGTRAQFMENYIRENPSGKKAEATVLGEGMNAFDKLWANMEVRLAMVPGKEVLSNLNFLLQESLKISVTSAIVVRNMRKDEIPLDLINILRELNEFAS